MSYVYVLADHTAGQISELTAELITAARVLGEPTVVMSATSDDASRVAAELGQLGAHRVITFTPDDTRVVIAETDALHALASAEPGPIVLAASSLGNEIAGRLAVRLASGVVTDAIAINADGTAVGSIFGDSYTVTSALGGSCPIYTLRPGAVDADPQPQQAQLLTLDIPSAGVLDVSVSEFIPAQVQQRPDLALAKVVVAGGRGVGSAEGFTEIVEPLADSLSAAVGATRDVVDNDWYPSHLQIGQTGVTVAPDLYLGVGVSGAIQHTAGMQTAKKIVVINNDEDAPLFDIADFGVVGDLHTIVPELTALIKQHTSS